MVPCPEGEQVRSSARTPLTRSESTVFNVMGQSMFRKSRGCDFLMDDGTPLEIKTNILSRAQLEEMLRSRAEGKHPLLAILDDDGTKVLTFSLEDVTEINRNFLRTRILEAHERGLGPNEIAALLHFPAAKVRKIMREELEVRP